MRFSILGPLLVHDGQTPVHVPGGRLRVLLAALLLRAGSPVAGDALADLVWDGSPPPGADITLRSHVSRLRGALGPEAGARLQTRPAGYLLQAGEDEVDALRFRRLCREGGAALREGTWAAADAALGEALGLWRGPALADIPSESLRRDEGRGLEALLLQAEEWRADAALRLGRHAEMVTELQALADRHPLREGLRVLLMLALYRSGRQAEALAAYQSARDALVADLGIEPGTELRDLHQRILAGTEPAWTEESRVLQVTPRELPPIAPGFAGRAAELGALTAILDQAGAGAPGTVVISAIGGTAGIGKTTLALHFAHQVAGRFPDGQLHVNLRGFSPAGDPAGPAEAVRRFLDALGVPPDRIPADPDAQAGLYRSMLADRRMLIMLDNARDEDQVRLLLPASPGSLVIVTSRAQLAGLAAAGGARLLALGTLTHDEALEMLAARIGAARAAAEPDATAEIAVLCARLPLALAVAAARAAASPAFPLTALAAELRDAGSRLDALDGTDPAVGVRAVLGWSYTRLSQDTARMFRLLGLHPGPDISVPAAASLAAVTQPFARRLLGELARDCLITEHAPRRYAFHDLLRVYALERAESGETEGARQEALSRLLWWYLDTARAAAEVVSPQSPQVPGEPRAPARPPLAFASAEAALAWYDDERPNLVAVTRASADAGLHEVASRLPPILFPMFNRRGDWADCITTHRIAIASAANTRNRLVEARALCMMGFALVKLPDPEAFPLLERALGIGEEFGDAPGEAMAAMALSEGHRNTHGACEDAIGYLRRAVDLLEPTASSPVRKAALNNLGDIYFELDDLDAAADSYLQALESTALGYLDGFVLFNLGRVHLRRHRVGEAIARFEEALPMLRAFGSMDGEALVLQGLGMAQAEGGGTAEARASLTDALRIFELIEDHEQAARTAALLASLSLGPGASTEPAGPPRAQDRQHRSGGGSPGPGPAATSPRPWPLQ